MTSPNTAEPAEPSLLRHILPVLAGGAVALLLTIVTDNTLGAHGLLPAPGQSMPGTGALLLVAAYRGLFVILGCHMAARLAPAGNPRIRYALGLGALIMVMNVIAAVSEWGRVPGWYSLSGIALTVPYAIIGGGTAVRAIARAQHQGRHETEP